MQQSIKLKTMDIAHPPAHPQLLPHPPATKFDIPSYTTMPLSAHVTFPGETPKWELYQSKARLCTKIKSYNKDCPCLVSGNLPFVKHQALP